MLQSLLSSGLKLRFALWAAEQALPSGADVKIRLRAGLLGMGAAVACGVLVALVFAATLVAGFFLLMHEGIPPYSAALAMLALAILIVYLLVCITRQQLARATQLLQHRPGVSQLVLAPRGAPSEHGLVQDMVDSFLTGLAGGKPHA